MFRSLYRHLVRLHPASFRVRFEEEMLWVFDEAVDTWGAASLVVDAGSSLIRQRLSQPEVSKWLAASVAGIALLIIAFGSFLPWDRALGR
ncbi:MAG TPA: hypothetical protein VJO16_01855 [Candidatus Acidoferrum sp.]|nr:hypothetical protein [Candidatus Acidoferrum sp.]